jgi:hypothetical protein
MSRTRRADSKVQDPAGRPPAEPDAKGRKPYAAPELIEYGTVAKLTQTGGSTTVDFVAMMGMKL